MFFLELGQYVFKMATLRSKFEGKEKTFRETELTLMSFMLSFYFWIF